MFLGDVSHAEAVLALEVVVGNIVGILFNYAAKLGIINRRALPAKTRSGQGVRCTDLEKRLSASGRCDKVGNQPQCRALLLRYNAANAFVLHFERWERRCQRPTCSS